MQKSLSSLLAAVIIIALTVTTSLIASSFFSTITQRQTHTSIQTSSCMGTVIIEQTSMTCNPSPPELEDNSVILYHFNQTSGNAIDEAGYDNNATVSGTVYTPGRFGNGLYFNGYDSYAYTDIPNTDEISVELWLRPEP